jgi:PAS domain S-box-containing protein
LPRTQKDTPTEKEQYKRLVEFAPVGLYEIKFEPPRFVWVNEETCRVLGHTREELLKMNPLDFLDEDGKRLFLGRIHRNLAGERVEPQAEFKVKTKDGKELWALITATFTRKNGVVDGALVAAQDVTERRQTEQETMRAKQLLEAHLNNAPEAVIEFDPEYRVLRWSKEAERVFGWSAEEILVGQNFNILRIVQQLFFLLYEFLAFNHVKPSTRQNLLVKRLD